MCVGIYAVCAIYLIVLLAIGYFNPNSAPPTGLKFNEENQVVISENGGTASLKVLDINAVISTGENGEQIIEDNTSPTEVRLTVRDMLGNIVTNIISVPETVMSGESFDITAVTVEEEYNGQVYTNNVGGDCFLIAETTDGLYHSNPLPIFVDVPIQNFTISAVDPETQESISLEEDAFIYDDQLQLNVSVFPERALNPHTNGDTTTKEFTFTADDTEKVTVGIHNGLVTVTYNPSNIGEDEVTEPELSTISVWVSPTYEQILADGVLVTVETTCDIRLFPVQLDEIIIQNEDYQDDTQQIDVVLFDETNRFSFSATETGIPGVVNMDIFLKPMNSDEHSTVLDNRISNLVVGWYSTLETPLSQVPVNIIEVDADNNGIIDYWTIEPLRAAEVDEEIYITITLQGYENKSISRILNIDYNLPDGIEYLVNGVAVENDQLNLEITKNGGGTDDIEAGDIVRQILDYNLTASSNLTFSKVMFFVDTTSMTNATGSLILNVNTETGQLNFINGNPIIEPRGAGQITITPYIVRTNSNGVPVDCNYNTIADGEADGFVWYNEFAPITDPNYYIVYASFAPLTVNVSELLESFTIYTGSEMTDDQLLTTTNNDRNNPLRIGTQIFNAQTLYAVPNSPLAIPRNSVEYPEWANTYGEIHFNVTQDPSSQSVLTVDSIDDISFHESGTLEDYERYISFDVYTENENPALGSVSIDLYQTLSGGDVSITTLRSEIFVSAEYIPVNEISINTDGTNIRATDPQGNDIKYLELTTVVSPLSRLYDGNYKNYVRVYWTSGGEQFVLPDATYSASSEWSQRGFRPSLSASPVISFYAFDLTETYDFSDVSAGYGSLSLLQVLTLEPNLLTEEGQALMERKREVINELLANTTANEYARVENIPQDDQVSISTIQIRKELPENYALFMTYSVDDELSDALPDFVRVSYSFPETHFFDNQALNTSPNAEENYVLTENDEFYFYQANVGYALVSTLAYADGVYDFTTNTSTRPTEYISSSTDEVVAYMGNLAGIFGGDSSYFNIEFLTTYNDETLPCVKLSLNTDSYRIEESEESHVYTLTVQRTINLALSVGWTDALWSDPSSLNGNWDTLLADSVAVTSIFTIKFVVENGQIVSV